MCAILMNTNGLKVYPAVLALENNFFLSQMTLYFTTFCGRDLNLKNCLFPWEN